jgi:hypothetical protein
MGQSARPTNARVATSTSIGNTIHSAERVRLRDLLSEPASFATLALNAGDPVERVLAITYGDRTDVALTLNSVTSPQGKRTFEFDRGPQSDVVNCVNGL